VETVVEIARPQEEAMSVAETLTEVSPAAQPPLAVKGALTNALKRQKRGEKK